MALLVLLLISIVIPRYSNICSIIVYSIMLCRFGDDLHLDTCIIDPCIIQAKAQRDGVQIHCHDVIYRFLDNVKAIMSEFLPMERKETLVGEAQTLEVREIHQHYPEPCSLGCAGPIFLRERLA